MAAIWDKVVASTRGLPALASTPGVQVATYNIGARTDDMFSGQSRPQFIQELREAFKTLCSNADVICLQEVSPAWRWELTAIIPVEWNVAHDPETTLLTMWDRRKLHMATDVELLKVFPHSTSIYKQWRKCLAVGLQLVNTCEIISVVNCHTIDGQDLRHIPGKRPNFTMSALRGSVAAAQQFRSALATAQGPGLPDSRTFLVLGDFNMSRDSAVIALRCMPPGEDGFSCEGMKNDFVISNAHQEPIILDNPVIAHDKKHRALLIRVDLLKVEEARVPTQDTVFAPGATRGKDTSGKADTTADEATPREVAQRRAAELLKELYQAMAARVKQEEEEDETEETTAGRAKEEAGRATEEAAASKAGLLAVVAAVAPLLSTTTTTITNAIATTIIVAAAIPTTLG